MAVSSFVGYRREGLLSPLPGENRRTVSCNEREYFRRHAYAMTNVADSIKSSSTATILELEEKSKCVKENSAPGDFFRTIQPFSPTDKKDENNIDINNEIEFNKFLEQLQQEKARKQFISQNREPVETQCPHCKYQVTTITRYHKGFGVWLSIAVFFLFCFP